jgi:hypothetical protein
MLITELGFCRIELCDDVNYEFEMMSKLFVLVFLRHPRVYLKRLRRNTKYSVREGHP